MKSLKGMFLTFSSECLCEADDVGVAEHPKNLHLSQSSFPQYFIVIRFLRKEHYPKNVLVRNVVYRNVLIRNVLIEIISVHTSSNYTYTV